MADVVVVVVLPICPVGQLPSGFSATLQKKLMLVVSVWPLSAKNLPVSADQLKQVLGAGPLAAVAQQAGVSADQGLGALTQLLPQLIDRLTPNGQLPQGGNLLQTGLDLLKKFT